MSIWFLQKIHLLIPPLLLQIMTISQQLLQLGGKIYHWLTKDILKSSGCLSLGHLVWFLGTWQDRTSFWMRNQMGGFSGI